MSLYNNNNNIFRIYIFIAVVVIIMIILIIYEGCNEKDEDEETEIVKYGKEIKPTSEVLDSSSDENDEENEDDEIKEENENDIIRNEGITRIESQEKDIYQNEYENEELDENEPDKNGKYKTD